MSLQGKKSLNIFIAFIVILVYTHSVTSSINYNKIRQDDQPSGEQPEEARTIRKILEMFNNQTIHKPIYTFQEATEHLLRFGALLRIEILDTFGPLVYDYYDDYSIRQTEALYRVYQETLERKYNIFEIVLSVLRNPDTRPTKICEHIHKHVHTCLKESSMSCMTMNKHDHPNPYSSLSAVVNVTRRFYKKSHIKKKFPKGFSLRAILNHLKRGTLNLTVGLMSGILHNIRYDSFDDEVRTAERNVMIMLSSEMLGSNRNKVLMQKDVLLSIHTVSDLLRELFERQKTAYGTKDKNKYFNILSKHVVCEVESISRNIELFGTIYDNNTIDIKYLLNLVLPQDVVDGDITDAKNYLVKKINDYDIVSKYLKIEKYQQSGPDQLLMEILGQMKDINFAVDLATALHVHSRFWRQSHMINNLNELLELFDAYENLRYVPKYSGLMSLMDKIRNTLWDSKNVTVEILCNNPRACLRLGLETVAKCPFINSETKTNIEELFHHLLKSEVTYDIEECIPEINSTEVINDSQTKQNPMRITGQVITDLTTPEIMITTELNDKSDRTIMSTANDEETMVTITTETATELLTISTEDTITNMTALTTDDDSEPRKQQTTDLTDSKNNEEQATTPITTESLVAPHVTIELTTEMEVTEEQLSSEHTILEPRSKELTTEETTTTEQTSTIFTEQSITEEEMRKMTETITTNSGESITNLMSTDETIIPMNDDDCYGEGCHLEILNEDIEVSSSDAWHTNRNPSPHLLSYNAKATESMDPPITTTIPTTTKNSIISTTVTKVITKSSTDQKPGLLKKPKSYSANSLEEDCSGEDCTLEDCSGDDCPEYFNPEVINNSTGCPGTTCNITDQTDCNEDDSCPPDSSTDICNDSNCKSNTTEQNYEQDCSGNGCSSAEILREIEKCEDAQCSTPSSEWDYSSTEIPLTSINASDCVDDDCSEGSNSNESNCNGDECSDRNEERLSKISQEINSPLQATDTPSVRCDNKDPHHQRKLDRLRKIRIMNALHAGKLVPPSRITDSVKDDDSTNKLPPPKAIKYRPTLSYHDLQSWLHFPRNELSKHNSLPWRQSSHQSFQAHNIEEEEFGHQSIESDMIRTKNRTKTKAYRNRNTNINFISLRRYVDEDTGDDTTPKPLRLQKMNLPNSSYRRVVTRVSKGLSSDRWEQKPQHESNANLRLKTTSKKSPYDSRKREVNSLRMKPVVYQTNESNDNIERMRKNRSIIRAPQRASRRYLR